MNTNKASQGPRAGLQTPMLIADIDIIPQITEGVCPFFRICRQVRGNNKQPTYSTVYHCRTRHRTS